MKDWKLVFRKHATIEREPGSVVPVLIWQISDRDEEHLDYYEGFPRYYVKKYMKIKATPMRGKKPVEISAMVYIMTEGTKILAPTMEYYKTILEGYKRFGFDTEILTDAFVDSFMQCTQDASN